MKKIISILTSLLFMASVVGVVSIMAPPSEYMPCDPSQYSMDKPVFQAGDVITIRVKEPNGPGLVWFFQSFNITDWHQPGDGWWEIKVAASVPGEVFLYPCTSNNIYYFGMFANCPSCSESYPCNKFSKTSFRVETFTLESRQNTHTVIF